MAQEPQKVIEGEVLDVQKQQRELMQLQDALSQNEQFTRFMELTKAVNTRMAEVRARVEEIMIPAYKEGKIDKSIKGDWGSVTVKENDEFEIDEKLLPKDYWKKVPNMTLIRGKFQLEGKVPKGTKQFKKYGIMMKLK